MPSRFALLGRRQAPHTGPLYGHGMQSWGASADHSVSAAMIARPANQIVPVMTFRFGAGHARQPSRRAMPGPSLLSRSGHKISPRISTAGTSVFVMSAGPSLAN